MAPYVKCFPTLREALDASSALRAQGWTNARYLWYNARGYAIEVGHNRFLFSDGTVR